MLFYYKSISGFTSQAAILKLLYQREGPNYRIDGQVISQRMEELITKAGVHKKWAVVRLLAAVLGKLVDSLAPSITTILVRGKQVSCAVLAPSSPPPLSVQSAQAVPTMWGF